MRGNPVNVRTVRELARCFGLGPLSLTYDMSTGSLSCRSLLTGVTTIMKADRFTEWSESCTCSKHCSLWPDLFAALWHDALLLRHGITAVVRRTFELDSSGCFFCIEGGSAAVVDEVTVVVAAQ